MQKTFSFPLIGGLDLTTPAATIKPGMVISSKNYEPNDEGGYRRLAGYERFDGLPSPTESSYWIVDFDAGSGTEPTPGDIITGLVSGASATLHLVVTESGAWGVDAVGYLVLIELGVTQFQDNEALQETAATFATSAGLSNERNADSDALDKTYLLAAQATRRALIAAVPGAGAVRGTWFYNGNVYAVRDNVGLTAGVLHRSSGAGWTVVDLGSYITFTTGAVTPFLEGEVVTQAVSGATGVIKAVGVTSGSFSGGNAAGRLYIKSVTGTFDATNTLSAPSTATGTSSSLLLADALPIGGKYEFRNYNFGGAIASYSMWGCSGVGRGFRYDGTDFAHVHVTGLTDALDKPEHLHTHKKQLFFSFLASLQHSGIGTPMVWNAVFGASELATGDVITSLKDQPGDILGVFNRNRTYLLYGDDVNNWDLVNFHLERGAIEWSVQDLGWSFYADDRGVQNLSQTDAYGDLKLAAISDRIDPLYQKQKLLIIDSVRIKAKNQYRIFYSDKSGLLMRWDNDSTAAGGMRHKFMAFEYLNKVESICAEEDTNGLERTFFGSDDGFVYEAEKGESFDGADIEYFLRTSFCHCKTPRQKKRFHKATIQVDGAETPPMAFSPEFSYGAADQPPPSVFQFPAGTFNVGGGVWDTDFWGSFIWDGQLVGEAQAYIDGQGINVSLLMQGASSFERQQT